MDRPLIHSAVAGGRWCTITTYFDGETPISGRLLFHSAEDSKRFADLVVGLNREMVSDIDRMAKAIIKYVERRISEIRTVEKNQPAFASTAEDELQRIAAVFGGVESFDELEEKQKPPWFADPDFLKGELEKIAMHPECPKAIYNIAADALCWARKVG